MVRKMEWGEVEKRLREVHGDTYTYKGDYETSSKKMTIICPTHGEFRQTYLAHYHQRQGCPQCGRRKSDEARTRTTESFVREALEVHGGRYSYPGDYMGIQKPIEILCPYHGVFQQIALNHLNGAGCKPCSLERLSQEGRESSESLLQRFREVHGERYDYSSVSFAEYYKAPAGEHRRMPIIIRCHRHGVFSQAVFDHLNGNGCPHCKQSRGESLIEHVLRGIGVPFERQKRFPGCRHKLPLPFDFYLPTLHRLIEFDGEQHAHPTKFSKKWSDAEATARLALTQKKDAIKDRFAREQRIPLLRLDTFTDLGMRVTEFCETVILPKLR